MRDLAEHKALFFKAVFDMLRQRYSRKLKNILLYVCFTICTARSGKHEPVGAVSDKFNIAVTETS